MTCVLQVTARIPNPSAQPHCPLQSSDSSGFISGWKDGRGREGRDQIMTQICSCSLAINFSMEPIRRWQQQLGNPGKALANKILLGLLAHSWSQIFQLLQPQP